MRTGSSRLAQPVRAVRYVLRPGSRSGRAGGPDGRTPRWPGGSGPRCGRGSSDPPWLHPASGVRRCLCAGAMSGLPLWRSCSRPRRWPVFTRVRQSSGSVAGPWRLRQCWFRWRRLPDHCASWVRSRHCDRCCCSSSSCSSPGFLVLCVAANAIVAGMLGVMRSTLEGHW